ncbi:MAG TPA: YbaK/EbsC family protein [Thermoleophilaceae bacterium]|nr:YbaK/EbsC family protein [Thermoleophilaceae bacterium]
MREKVVAAARELGLEVEIRTLDRPTRTVAEAAAALDVDAGQIAKSLVFLADGEPVVIVASGAGRVDVDQLALVCDCAMIDKATPEDVRAATGFSVGGVPPFGHGLPVMVDEALLEYEEVYAAGGDGNTLFAVDPRALAEATGARIVRVAELAGS